MTRTISHKQKLEYLPFLIERDGGFRCWYCKRDLRMRMYVYDHLNCDRSDNRVENIVLSCQSCNIKKTHDSDMQILAKDKLKENEDQNFLRERTYTEAQEKSHTSTEISINESNFDLTEQYITERIQTDGSIHFSTALDCCTYICKKKTGHGSQQSIRQYIATLTSEIGPFMIILDENKKKKIQKRKGQ